MLSTANSGTVKSMRMPPFRSGESPEHMSWNAGSSLSAFRLSLPHLQQLARLLGARGREAVLAGDDAGQRDEVAPLERRPCALEVLRHRAVVLLRVQSAVLADAVLQ